MYEGIEPFYNLLSGKNQKKGIDEKFPISLLAIHFT